MSEQTAQDYLRPPESSFWLWDQEGKVLQWADSRTIAFVPELHAAAMRFKTTGMPPFGAIVLAMAAMRDGWNADESQRGTFVGFVRSVLSPGADLPGILQDLLRDALARLDAVAALPVDLRTGIKEGRAILVEMLFEGVSPSLPRAEVPLVINILSQRIPEMAEPARASQPAAEALAILKSLAGARLLTNAESIRLRQRTGLEQLPQGAQVHISDKVRGLLKDLRGDPQLGGLAKLAREMLAVIATPRRLVPEHELPLGGFSDISNRGHLDRLLITELAHDDLTLAVRVAMNEALYLRRESPRTPQAFTRTLFLDTGIRLWGIPRLFVTAVALAFAATTPKEAQLSVYSASREKLQTTDLTTRAGLLAHLEQLEPSPHPGDALRALKAEVEDTLGQNDETIVITHPDTFADPHFQKALLTAGISPYLEATVEETGRFSLSLTSPAGKRKLEEATLDLADVMAPSATIAPAPLLNTQRDLPAMLRLVISPFRLPLTADLKHAVSSPKYGLIALAGRALVQWPSEGSPNTLIKTIPQGNFVGLFFFEQHGHVVMAVYDPIDRNLCCFSVDLATRQAVESRIPMPAEPLGLGGHNGVIFSITPGKVDAHTLDQITPAGSVEFPKSNRLIGSRFLLGDAGKVLAACYEGSTVLLRDVELPPNPILVFQRQGVDGPIGLYPDGSVRTSTGKTLIGSAGWSISASRFSPRISHDGARIALEISMDFHTTTHFVLDLALDAPSWRSLEAAHLDRFLVGPAADFAAEIRTQLRRRMAGVCLDHCNNLALVSRRQKMLTIDLQRGCLALTGRYQNGQKYRSFGEKLFAAEAKLPGLQTTRWSDGSRIWMDPRGILHLRSTDPLAPELSILLAESSRFITAWSSDGKTYGNPAHLQSPPTGKTDELRIHLLAFIARLT